MQEIFRRFVTKQFGSPRGLFGKIIGNRMAKGNVYDARWTISLLDTRPKRGKGTRKSSISWNVRHD
jgi:hypothetical protein